MFKKKPGHCAGLFCVPPFPVATPQLITACPATSERLKCCYIHVLNLRYCLLHFAGQ